ncbi:TetR/AcrR family transcriptional regulator [Bacillus luti]|uniref:TetR/AcrR family transcriptional regulator n=1 Tax=Bacillus luti TaxID=2026191 RepID=A0A7V7V6F4_9BACI|nr:TetR/AcrR family transcriptional regulator [Bacillus luti]KAB2443663.1 TetR/AcrR family transcriptional regulator [Bacillus luti]
MAETKIDPRIIRTHRLIMDSFIQLSMRKDFKDITIKDITTEATVNRATFYYHFTDKYDLLEKTLKENLMKNVIHEIAEHVEINETTIINIFLSVTKFQNNLSSQCQRSFNSFQGTIEEVIKNELQRIFYEILLKQQATTKTDDFETLRIGSAMLAWGLYGATVDWQYNSTNPPEDYIRRAIPYIFNGMGSLKR